MWGVNGEGTRKGGTEADGDTRHALYLGETAEDGTFSPGPSIHPGAGGWPGASVPAEPRMFLSSTPTFRAREGYWPPSEMSGLLLSSDPRGTGLVSPFSQAARKLVVKSEAHPQLS